ncbi:hypothetical protein PR202_gb00727 [Eleusine coracana subsp. coracana]|uniref:Non-specific lipid-transfer protein n=1 Tax=Eleusine coracana subsp. coracana TaxID=191504 RepID=A0AAV5DSL2_ELECO|nr:hypothetical protein PR202_gb00727 [Eleusine coracana subsp. coracana]
MARGSSAQQLAVSAVLVAALLLAAAAPPAVNAAVTCGQVVSMLSPCVRYAMGAVQTPPATCCGGVRSLSAAARSTADRQATCNCLKQQTSGMGGLKPGIVAGIPAKCNVNVPYAISPSTDCSK